MAQYKKLEDYCTNFNETREAFTKKPTAVPVPVPQGIISVTDQNHLDKLKQIPNIILIVKHYATWCGPCKGFAPKFKQLMAEETDPIVTAAEVDIDQVQTQTPGVPTTEFYYNGHKVGTVTGGDVTKVKETLAKVKSMLKSKVKKGTGSGAATGGGPRTTLSRCPSATHSYVPANPETGEPEKCCTADAPNVYDPVTMTISTRPGECRPLYPN